LRAAEDSGIPADEVEGVLVKDGSHGFIELGELVTEMNGAFEEDLDGDCPEFVVVGSGIVTEQVFDADLLHGGKDRAGNLGKVGELLFEMPVFIRLGDEVDIGEGMSHFMEAYVAIGSLVRNPFDEIIPGKIDAGLIYMAHEWPGIEPIMVVIPQDEDIVEIIEFEFFQAKSQLDGDGADEDRHFRSPFHLDIPEVLGVFKQPGTEEKFALLFQSQPVIIGQVAGNNRMIEGLPYNKTLKLVPVVEALNKQRNGAV
jgi:hypothetical protein